MGILIIYLIYSRNFLLKGAKYKKLYLGYIKINKNVFQIKEIFLNIYIYIYLKFGNRIDRLKIAVLKYHDMQLKFLNKLSCRYI